MGLKTFVKVGEISNLSDARYCAGMGVDLLGFNVNSESPYYVSPDTFKDLSGWVAGVKFVGECSGMSVDDIKLATQDYDFDYLQVDEIDQLTELADLGVELILYLNVSDDATIQNLQNLIESAAEECEMVIVATDNPDYYTSIRDVVSEVSENVKILKGFDITEKNVSSTIDEGRFMGIELKGSEEEQPGFKDYGDLMDILEALDEY
ncbi:MAG: N-(5'-phosphoribosyl)anthranilate isomerase [Cyclobacteriaceae bacterium]